MSEQVPPRVFAATDPALPGHFPGQPVVPGVLLLDAVIASAIELWGDALAVGGVERVKFLRALAPDEPFRVRLRLKNESLAQFSCLIEEELIATGDLRLHRHDETPT